MSASSRHESKKARERRQLVDPNEPRVDMGPRPWPSEAQMLAKLEGRWERRWSETANRPDTLPHQHGTGNGRVSHKRNEY